MTSFSNQTKVTNRNQDKHNPELLEALGSTKENWFKELNEIFSKDVFEENSNASTFDENCELVCEEDFLLPPSPKLVRGKKLRRRRRKNVNGVHSMNQEADDSLSQMLLVDTKKINNSFIYPTLLEQNNHDQSNNKLNSLKNNVALRSACTDTLNTGNTASTIIQRYECNNKIDKLKKNVLFGKVCKSTLTTSTTLNGSTSNNVYKTIKSEIPTVSLQNGIHKPSMGHLKTDVLSTSREEYNPWKNDTSNIDVTPKTMHKIVVSPCNSKKELIFSPITMSDCRVSTSSNFSKRNIQYTSSPKLKCNKFTDLPKSDESLNLDHVEMFEISTQFCKEFEESFEDVSCKNKSTNIFDDIDKIESFGSIRSEIISRKKRHLKEREKQLSDSKNGTSLSDTSDINKSNKTVNSTHENLGQQNMNNKMLVSKHEFKMVNPTTELKMVHPKPEYKKVNSNPEFKGGNPDPILPIDNSVSQKDFVGFQTAAFKTINVSEKALAKAASVFDNLEKTNLQKTPIKSKQRDISTSLTNQGFLTANKRSVKISQAAFNKTNEIFANVEETKAKKAGFCGFKTANLKELKISNQAMQRANHLFEVLDGKENRMEQIVGFKTANCKEIKISDKAKQKANSLFAGIDKENKEEKDMVEINNCGTKSKNLSQTLTTVSRTKNIHVTKPITAGRCIKNVGQNVELKTAQIPQNLNHSLGMNKGVAALPKPEFTEKYTEDICQNIPKLDQMPQNLNTNLDSVKSLPKPVLHSPMYKTPNSKQLINSTTPLVRSAKRRNSTYKPPRSVKKKCT